MTGLGDNKMNKKEEQKSTSQKKNTSSESSVIQLKRNRKTLVKWAIVVFLFIITGLSLIHI